MNDAWRLILAPLVPWPVIAALGALALAIVLFALIRRARGAWLRGLAALVLLTILANPSMVEEQRRYAKDVAVAVIDDSPSQDIGDRRAKAAAALARLQSQAAEQTDLELRVVHAGAEPDAASTDAGTRLFTALDRALAEVPRRRFAGAVMITDGQIHDVPRADAGMAGPIHALLTGAPGEADRRLVIVRSPGFGLVDKTATLTIRVEDSAGGAAIPVTVRRDGGDSRVIAVEPNRDTDMEIPLTHGGETIVELSASAGTKELTLANNRAVVSINGIRDRLRVLLISGEPHPGERTWRNLLKADPSVDLVHFTILRPPEKQDGTPINELSLIAFPIRELFEVKLNEFDLIVFDRYRRRNIVPNAYLKAIGDYVQRGGALLEAAGPSYATNMGLYFSPLGDVLPGEPTGRVLSQGFRPVVTPTGIRHPVTTGLEGGGPEPRWGRWFRQIEMTPRGGQVVMSGIDGEPLLMLDRVGQGRVAQLASDHIWLWSRGYEGGGPQAELLRRLAHWLMKEPALEEEDLTARARGARLEITRRSLTPGAVTATVTEPSGTQRQVELTENGSGAAVGATPLAGPGLYRIEDGARSKLVAVGAVNPRELADVRTTETAIKPVVDATDGGTFWLGRGDTPDLRRVRADRSAHGRDWFGLVERRDYDVVGLNRYPLLPVLAALALALVAAMAAWHREGR